jgi:syntaxin 1B/2/3
MNDLLSDENNNRHVIQMGENSTATAQTLEKFFEEVEAVKKELKELDQLHINLRNSHEKSKKLHSAKTVKELRSKMDSDVTLSLKKAKLIKSRLESLDRSNEASRSLPDCGPGSSSDRTRSGVVSGLRKNLKDSMESFNGLREQISSEYKETVQRRYFTVTGEKADDKTVDLLISTGMHLNDIYFCLLSLTQLTEYCIIYVGVKLEHRSFHLSEIFSYQTTIYILNFSF